MSFRCFACKKAFQGAPIRLVVRTKTIPMKMYTNEATKQKLLQPLREPDHVSDRSVECIAQEGDHCEQCAILFDVVREDVSASL